MSTSRTRQKPAVDDDELRSYASYDASHWEHAAWHAERTAEIRRNAITNPDDSEALRDLGIALINEEKYIEAVAVLRQAVSIRPDEPTAYKYLGRALSEAGYSADAIAAYRQATLVDSDDAELYFELGSELHLAGQLDDSIHVYHRLVALDPEGRWDPYYYLGISLLHNGQFDEAITALKQGMRPKSRLGTENDKAYREWIDEARKAKKKAEAAATKKGRTKHGRRAIKGRAQEKGLKTPTK